MNDVSGFYRCGSLSPAGRGWRAVSAPGEGPSARRYLQYLNKPLEIIKQLPRSKQKILVVKSYDGHSKLLKSFRSPCITLPRPCVIVAGSIKFNGKPKLSAVEVDDVVFNLMLSPELHAIVFASTEKTPESSLRACLVLS